MKSIKTLLENIEDEVYHSPDKVLTNDEDLYFTQKDAIPFFVLKNGEVVALPKRSKHIDFYKAITNPIQRRRFINSVKLQGRYWENHNIFSFWKLGSEDMFYITKAINKLVDPNKQGYVYYKDKIYDIEYDDDRIWLKKEETVPEEEKVSELSEEKMNLIQRLFESDKNYFKRAFFMTTYIKGRTETRKLNSYEELCGGCYQFWSDYLRRKEGKFTTEEFKLFIDIITNHRHSFDELLDYFHNTMRRKLVTANNIPDISTTILKDEEHNPIIDLLNRFNVNDTEYDVVNYEGTDYPYSYNLHIIDDNAKFQTIYYQAKNSGKINIDRVSIRKLYNDETMCSCRLRLNAEYDKYWDEK